MFPRVIFDEAWRKPGIGRVEKQCSFVSENVMLLAMM